MADIIGKVYNSNNYGKFKVNKELEIVGYKIGDKKDKVYEIEFLDTGSTGTASYEAMRRGRVRDRYAPSVANIGIIGDIDKITDENV